MKKIITTLSFAICIFNIGIAQYYYFEVKTPHGTIVGNPSGTSTANWGTYKYTGTDKNSSQITEDSLWVVTNHPGAIVVGPATWKYNCHAFAWYMNGDPTADKVWMTDPRAYVSTNDKSYGYILGSPDNSKVLYSVAPTNGTPRYNEVRPMHSAIYIGNRLARSKWGDLSLVEHDPDNVPDEYKDFNDTTVYAYYFVRTPAVISGPSVVCYANTSFSLSNAPSNVTWHISNPSLFSFVGSNTGNSVTLIRAGVIPGGNAALEARVGSSTVIASKSIITCSLAIDGPTYVSCGDYLEYSIPYIPGASYSWSSDNGHLLFFQSSGNTANFFVKGYGNFPNGWAQDNVRCTITLGGVTYNNFYTQVYIECY